MDLRNTIASLVNMAEDDLIENLTLPPLRILGSKTFGQCALFKAGELTLPPNRSVLPVDRLGCAEVRL